ncbi:hypothetical protein SOVF_169310 [Spinacia oleracea]|nr:hypothetical protein SOVF_169310 [Spinacia oleracea]
MNHKLNEDCDGEVSSSSKSQPDDSDDEDFKADGFDDEDDVVVQTTATINCKVEAFGRIIHRFDNRRRQWVSEMGFGGLYHLCGKHLPRNFVYWLMTRVDPVNEVFRGPNGFDVPMNKNQVRWILGLLNGEKVIPNNDVDADERMKRLGHKIQRQYGRSWASVNPNKTGVVTPT